MLLAGHPITLTPSHPAEDDETPPSVTINQASTQSDPTGASTINYTVAFSKSVTDFATGDVTLGGTAGATTAVVTGSGSTYNVAVSGMTGSGTVTAEIAAGVAQDSASNPNYASTSTDNTVTYNLSTSAAVTQDGAVSTGTGAAGATSLSFSHTTGTGTNRLLLVGLSYNCGTSSPVPTISSVTFTYGSTVLNLAQEISQQTASTTKRYAAIYYSPTEPPQNTTGTVAITFSAGVSNGIIAGAANFAGVDQTTPFSVSNGANSSSTGTTQSVTLNSLNGNELVFDTVFIGGTTPADPTVGANQTRLWTGTTSNTRGVASTEQATGSSVTMSWTTSSAMAWASAAVAISPVAGPDTTPPSVTINQASAQSDPTSATTINYTVLFSEPVTGFETGDVTLSGTAGAATAVVTGSGSTYNVAVSGMTGSGTVTAEIAAGVAQDSASNPNYASTSTDNTVTYNLSTTTTVTLDGAVSTGTGAANATSLSFSHTTGAGTNRLLLVGLSYNCGSTTRTISSVTFTYGSTVLNLSQRIVQETASTAQRYAAIWYSPTEPPQNTTGTVAITFSGTVSNGIIAGAANFAGVNQSTPFTISNGANSSSTGTTQTVTLNSLNGNELVFDTIFVGVSTSAMVDPTVGSNQTSLWTGTTSNTRGVASTEQATGSSVTMSWTTGTTAVVWASAAVAINPASATTAYTLSITSANGTVTKNPDKATYSAGETVELTAAPASGYYFNNWSGAVSSTDNPVTITMDGNKSVTANYVSSTTTFTGTELLGRPEANSIGISVLPDTAVSLRYQYGTSSGNYSNTTTPVSASAGVPQVVTISGLTANAKYYYRLQYSTNGGRDWTSRSENTFWTQRASGSTFSFTITSDSHINIALGNTTTWTNTLNDVKDDAADFEIDLGDTVAMDDGTSSVAIGDTAAAEQRYKDALPYFNIISGSSPLFMIAGNHEQQEAWHQLAPVASSLPIMGKNAEKKFFLNPVSDTFYSGDTGTNSNLSGDQLRQAYYAWTWGDALFVVINPFWFTTTKPYTTTVGGGEGDTTGSGNRWDWTLGQDQFNWLKSTLEGSSAKYKFIFSHQIVGGNGWTSPDMVNYGHGGVDSANLVEWGGYNVGGTVWGWNTQRSGWGSQTIHQMMVANGVTAFFHGHDHQYAYEKMDGIVYQSVPSGGFTTNFGMYQDGGNDGKTIEAVNGSGHLLVTVGPTASTVDLIQTGASSPAYSYNMTP